MKEKQYEWMIYVLFFLFVVACWAGFIWFAIWLASKYF